MRSMQVRSRAASPFASSRQAEILPVSLSWCGFGGGAGADEQGDKTDDDGAETIHWVLH